VIENSVLGILQTSRKTVIKLALGMMLLGSVFMLTNNNLLEYYADSLAPFAWGMFLGALLIRPVAAK